MNDEDVAFRIVRLYFEEIARLGFKRQLDLDQMINSYFYTLKKLEDKGAMKRIVQEVIKEEKKEEKEEPQIIKSVTTTTKTETKPIDSVEEKKSTKTESIYKEDNRAITDIVEE